MKKPVLVATIMMVSFFQTACEMNILSNDQASLLSGNTSTTTTSLTNSLNSSIPAGLTNPLQALTGTAASAAPASTVAAMPFAPLPEDVAPTPTQTSAIASVARINTAYFLVKPVKATTPSAVSVR